MKRLFFAFLFAFVIHGISFVSDFSKNRGVWVSNDAEALVRLLELNVNHLVNKF